MENDWKVEDVKLELRGYVGPWAFVLLSDKLVGRMSLVLAWALALVQEVVDHQGGQVSYLESEHG